MCDTFRPLKLTTLSRDLEIPQKRHVQFRDPDAPGAGDGSAPLLVEEVLGFEGFSGNKSILYHLWSPCRVNDVGEFTPIEIEEWVPETHVHRLTDTMGLEPMGDSGARPARAAVQRRRRDRDLHPRARGGLLLPRRRGRRGHLRPRGRGRGRDDLRHAALPQARLRRDPARDDLPLPLRHAAALADLLHAGRDRDPEPLPQPLRAAARARAVLAARLPPAGRARRPTATAASTWSRCASGAATRTTCSTTTRSTSSAGTATCTRTRSTSPTSSPRPGAAPAAAGPPDVPGPELRDLLVLPADAGLGPTAIAIPYHHSNLQSEEIIYYVDGQFGSRKGVDVGAITLHPSGLPHGPQPGLVEKSLGASAPRSSR